MNLPGASAPRNLGTLTPESRLTIGRRNHAALVPDLENNHLSLKWDSRRQAVLVKLLVEGDDARLIDRDDGSETLLHHEQFELWEWNKKLSLRSYEFVLEQPSQNTVQVHVEPDPVTVFIGEPQTITVRFTNDGSHDITVKALFDEPYHAWIRNADHTVSVPAQGDQALPLEIVSPDSPDIDLGPKKIRLRAIDASPKKTPYGETHCTWNIRPREGCKMEVNPTSHRAWQHAPFGKKYRITIQNRGSREEAYELRTDIGDRYNLDYTWSESNFSLRSGATKKNITLKVRPNGTAQNYRFRIDVLKEDQQVAQSKECEFITTSRSAFMPGWLGRAWVLIPMLIAIALLGGAFLAWIFNRMPETVSDSEATQTAAAQVAQVSTPTIDTTSTAASQSVLETQEALAATQTALNGADAARSPQDAILPTDRPTAPPPPTAAPTPVPTPTREPTSTISPPTEAPTPDSAATEAAHDQATTAEARTEVALGRTDTAIERSDQQAATSSAREQQAESVAQNQAATSQSRTDNAVETAAVQTQTAESWTQIAIPSSMRQTETAIARMETAVSANENGTVVANNRTEQALAQTVARQTEQPVTETADAQMQQTDLARTAVQQTSQAQTQTATAKTTLPTSTPTGAATPIPGFVDLHVEVGVDPDSDANPVAPGVELVYTVKITNQGEVPAAFISMFSQLTQSGNSETSFQYLRPFENAACSESNQIVSCTQNSLGAGAKTSFKIKVQAPECAAELTNAVTVRSDTEEPERDRDDNLDSITTQVGNPEPPEVSIQFKPSEVTLNDVSELVFEITNPNPGIALDVIELDASLPDGLELEDSGSRNECGGKVEFSNANIRFSDGRVEANGSCSFNARVKATHQGNNSRKLTTSPIQATSCGQLEGDSSSATLAVRPPRKIDIIAGTDQETPVTTEFPQPLRVKVVDKDGNPVSDVMVVFEVVDSSAKASGTFEGNKKKFTKETDENGEVETSTFTANKYAGEYKVKASLEDYNDVPAATFNLENLPGPPAKIKIEGDKTQETRINTNFDELVVRVTDEYNNPVPGRTVTFAGPASGPGIVPASKDVETDADGEASVTLRANGEVGEYDVTVQISGAEEEQLRLENTSD
jgi:hypothetical protein